MVPTIAPKLFIPNGRTLLNFGGSSEAVPSLVSTPPDHSASATDPSGLTIPAVTTPLLLSAPPLVLKKGSGVTA
jgi:hypothetical protein